MTNEHIIKMKDIYSQRKKRIKIKLRKDNNFNNNNISLLSKTINTRKGLFSLKKNCYILMQIYLLLIILIIKKIFLLHFL